MLEIKTADQLADSILEQRWRARRAGYQADVLREILRAFAETAGPVPITIITAAFRDRPAGMIADALRVLDTDDLVQLDGDQVVIAYPFASARTPFVVRLQSGADRYACCAIDALGIAPMLGEPVRVLSGCHHCRESLTFEVGPDGPEPDAEGVMAWVETRREGERRIATSL